MQGMVLKGVVAMAAMAALTSGFSPAVSYTSGVIAPHAVLSPLQTARVAVSKARPCLGLRASSGTDTATESVYKFVSSPAGRIGFLVNTWKTQAENQRSRGWTSSTEEEMIELQRVAATAEQLKGGMQMIMQRAAAEQAAQANGGEMPDSIPENIAKLNLLAAISSGHGSAVGLYQKTDDAIDIQMLIANTQLDGQFKAQKGLVDKLVAEAKEAKLAVRLAASTHETLFGEYQDLGFHEVGEGEDWSAHKDL